MKAQVSTPSYYDKETLIKLLIYFISTNIGLGMRCHQGNVLQHGEVDLQLEANPRDKADIDQLSEILLL